MNIGEVTNGGLSTPEHLKQRSVEQVKSAELRATTRADVSHERQEPQDSVAISDEARKALAEDQKKLADLERALKALETVPQLSAARKREIQERIDTAYYSKPEILEKIAAKLNREIGE